MSDGEMGLKYDDGIVIFREGEEGDCMYYITKGKAKISINSPK
jgi:CRP-like cAMP-binding protein